MSNKPPAAYENALRDLFGNMSISKNTASNTTKKNKAANNNIKYTTSLKAKVTKAANPIERMKTASQHMRNFIKKYNAAHNADNKAKVQTYNEYGQDLGAKLYNVTKKHKNVVMNMITNKSVNAAAIRDVLDEDFLFESTPEYVIQYSKFLDGIVKSYEDAIKRNDKEKAVKIWNFATEIMKLLQQIAGEKRAYSMGNTTPSAANTYNPFNDPEVMKNIKPEEGPSVFNMFNNVPKNVTASAIKNTKKGTRKAAPKLSSILNASVTNTANALKNASMARMTAKVKLTEEEKAAAKLVKEAAAAVNGARKAEEKAFKAAAKQQAALEKAALQEQKEKEKAAKKALKEAEALVKSAAKKIKAESVKKGAVVEFDPFA
jgi:hypothetical protein